MKKPFFLGLAVASLTLFFASPSMATQNCAWIYSGECSRSCGQSSGQSAIKEGLTCAACTQWCYAFRPATPQLQTVEAQGVSSEGVAYVSEDVKNNLQVPLQVDDASLYAIAQVNALAALAVSALTSDNAPIAFNLIHGKMSIKGQPTTNTLVLRMQHAALDEQARSVVPLANAGHHLEVTWLGTRKDPHTLAVRFEVSELDDEDVPIKKLASDIEVLVKDGKAPHVVGWHVAN